MKAKKIMTYFELTYNLSHDLMLSNCKFKVLNSEDTRIYEFKEGDCISCDDESIRFEDMYKNCKIFDIQLEILNEDEFKNNNIKDLIYDENKYYTEEEFLNKNNKIKNDFEYDTWDNTPKAVAYERARKEVIDMLETKYMDLEMEIDNCQGAMEKLNQAFEELNIYKKLVKYLGGDIDAHKQELLEKWFNIK